MNPRTPVDPSPPHIMRRAALGLLLAGALAASACGRAGPLEPPPDPNAVAKPADNDPTHVQARRKPPPITPPKTGFFLDPLL